MHYAAEAQETSTPERQTYSDWLVTCDEGDGCRMTQAIVQPATQRLILQAKIFTGDNPTLLMTFPLGILLSTGWQYQIDGNKQVIEPFEICNLEGCHAGVRLTPHLLNAMKRGSRMKIKFLDAARTEVDPVISLTGFTKAYQALK